MKIYLAARLSLWPTMNQAATFLERHGHVITSRWHRRGPKETGLPYGRAGNPILAYYAAEDLADIDAAEAVVLFTQAGQHFAGGRHVEAGYALGKGKRLFVFGPRENIFYHLPSVGQAMDWEELVNLLRLEPGRLEDSPAGVGITSCRSFL